MKILIIGGTIFLGKHITQAALKQGIDVTHFNRGIHNPDLFEGIEKIKGDRKEDLSGLEGKTWDAVIDTSGYTPDVVRKSAEFLRDSTSKYIFISSISVYSNFRDAGINEEHSTAELKDGNINEVTNENYGALKALCEQEVEHIYPGNFVNVRPGLIVGPDDPTDRFTYWINRISKGGEVLAPGSGDDVIQFIDVRDLAEWIIYLCAPEFKGYFNATGPKEDLKMKDFLMQVRTELNSDAMLVWADDKFLEQNEVHPWSGMPVWVPEGDEEMKGISKVYIGKALNNGLHFRPLRETIRDTYEWDISRGEDYKLKAGIDSIREAELLEKLK